MKVVYALQEFPKSWEHSIFLAGPTPRDSKTKSWRPDALKILEELNYDGVVFVPETKDFTWKHNYDHQVEWEKAGLNFADKIVFWVPRDLESMPAFTTNVEFGRAVDTGKAILGAPPEAPKNTYLKWMAKDSKVTPVYDSLYETLQAAVQHPNLPIRFGGERYIPAEIFTTPMFQSWYNQQTAVGNILNFAAIKWVHRIKNVDVFSFVIHVDIWVKQDNKNKSIEWIFSRKDTACVVPYYLNDNLLDSKVVLISEFRPAVRNNKAYIFELPGGSIEPNEYIKEAALRELEEEAGIFVDIDRLVPIESRQAIGILSTHHVYPFGLSLTKEEFEKIEQDVLQHKQFVTSPDEITNLNIYSIKELLDNSYIDWTTIGIIFKAIMEK